MPTGYREPVRAELVVRSDLATSVYLWTIWWTVVALLGALTYLRDSALRLPLCALVLGSAVAGLAIARALARRFRWRLTVAGRELRIELESPGSRELVAALDVDAGVHLGTDLPPGAGKLEQRILFKTPGGGAVWSPGMRIGLVHDRLVQFLREHHIDVETTPDTPGRGSGSMGTHGG